MVGSMSSTARPHPTDPLPNGAAAAETPAAFTHAQIMQVIGGIILCILLAALDQTVVIPAVPAIAADLNGFGHLSWIVTAYLLTSTAATPIYGKLSDIYGRRALLLPALALFILSSVLCALSQSLFQLIVFRALQGLGGAGLMSMAQAAIADVVSPRERGRYQGYMASMWGIASIAGPIVGGFVTDHLSWRWVFWINLPIGLAAMWLSNRGLRILRVQRRQARIDYPGAALLTTGVTAALLLLSWGGNEYPWPSPTILGLGALAAAMFAILFWHERRDADPLLPPRIFRSNVFVRGILIAFFASLGLFGATFLLPLFLQLVRGTDASLSGLLVIPFLLTNVLGAFTAGRTIKRLGRTRGLVLAGLSTSALGFVALAVVGATTSWAVLLLGMVLVGGGIGLTLPSTLVTVQNAAERRDVGVATGTMLFLRSMGGAFGSTVVGAILALRFADAVAAAGVTRAIDLGALRHGRGTGAADPLAGLDAAARAQVLDGLLSGFHLSFALCAVLTVVGVIIAAGMRDIPLRTTSAAAGEEPQAAAIGH